MKRLQIVDHNINIGHCKVYSTDFVTNILWFIKLLNSEFRIRNSEFRIPNSEFRIPHFEKNVVYRKLFLENIPYSDQYLYYDQLFVVSSYIN